jgi:hypothetical protein
MQTQNAHALLELMRTRVYIMKHADRLVCDEGLLKVKHRHRSFYPLMGPHWKCSFDNLNQPHTVSLFYGTWSFSYPLYEPPIVENSFSNTSSFTNELSLSENDGVDHLT